MNTPYPVPPPHEEIKNAQKHWATKTVRPVQEATEQLLLHQIQNNPRSLQKRVGPSELGMDCEHCLTAKLAGWTKTEEGIPWASTVGTAIHAHLETLIWQHNLQTERDNHHQPHRYYTEQTITVGTINGEPITGSIDVLDVATKTTIDWKCVSPTSLNQYKKNGPSNQYRVQAHLYAKGCNDSGIKVENVAICFLPRASNNFYQRHWWTEPYNPQIAEDALNRANRIVSNLTAMNSLGTQARDKWISSLPRAPHCWDCNRYPDKPDEPTTSGINLPIKK